MKRSYLIFFSIGLLAALCICAAAQDETADDWYKKGLNLGRNGSYEEAVLAYNRAIELEPGNTTFYIAKVPSLNMLAIITNNQSRRNESMEAIDKALAIDPKNPRAWEMKGEVLSQMEKYNESVDAYEKAIKDIGSYRQDIHANQTEFLSYIWTSKSISLWQLMMYNESLAAVDEAVRIDPTGNYDAWAFKGELLASLGRYNESLQAFDGAAAIGTAGSSPEIAALPWAAEGYVLMQMGRYEEADLLCQKIISLNLTGEGADRRLAEAWRGRGNALARLGEYNQSLQAFDKAVELNPERTPYAWTGKGDTLRTSGRHDEALKAYDRALELYPDFADAGMARAQKGRGDSLAILGRQEEALAAYGVAAEASDKAITEFNNATPLDRAVSFTFDPYPLDQKFWTDRGSILKILDRQEDSRQAYGKALETANRSLLQNPADFNAHDAKAKLLFEMGRYDESVQVYDQFIKTDPGPKASATALSWKGRLLFEMGRANESLDNLVRATETDPQSFDAWRWSAGISAELGRYEEALNAYNVALQLGGQPENAEIWREKGGVLKALGRQSEADAAFAISRELEDGGL